MSHDQPLSTMLAGRRSDPSPATPIHLTEEAKYLVNHYRRELKVFANMNPNRLNEWCILYIYSDQCLARYSPDRLQSLSKLQASKRSQFFSFHAQLQLWNRTGIEDAVPRCIELMSTRFAADSLAIRGRLGASLWRSWAHAKVSQELYAMIANRAADDYAVIFDGMPPTSVPSHLNIGMNAVHSPQPGSVPANGLHTPDTPGRGGPHHQPSMIDHNALHGANVSGGFTDLRPQTQMSHVAMQSAMQDTTQNSYIPNYLSAYAGQTSTILPSSVGQGLHVQTPGLPMNTFDSTRNHYGAEQPSSLRQPESHSYLPMGRGKPAKDVFGMTSHMLTSVGGTNQITGRQPAASSVDQPATVSIREPSMSRAAIPTAVPAHSSTIGPQANARTRAQRYRSSRTHPLHAGRAPIISEIQHSRKPGQSFQSMQDDQQQYHACSSMLQPQNSVPQQTADKSKRRMSTAALESLSSAIFEKNRFEKSSKKLKTKLPSLDTNSNQPVASSKRQHDTALFQTGLKAKSQHLNSCSPSVEIESVASLHDDEHLESYEILKDIIDFGDDNAHPDNLVITQPSAPAVKRANSPVAGSQQPECIDLISNRENPANILAADLNAIMKSSSSNFEDGRMYSNLELFGSDMVVDRSVLHARNQGPEEALPPAESVSRSVQATDEEATKAGTNVLDQPYEAGSQQALDELLFEQQLEAALMAAFSDSDS